MAKAFASTGDMAEKKVTFGKIGDGLYAYTAEGDPNTGVIVGDDSCMVVDAQATPLMAQDVIARVKTVTDKPIKYVVLSHYHAVRVLGASAFNAAEILASDATRKLIVERGEQDKASEIGRFPRLFRGVDSVPPGMTWPTLTFKDGITLWLGKRRVDIVQIGRGHTAGDTIAWVPDSGVMFSGDLVEYRSACYCGDAHFTDWPATLDEDRRLQAEGAGARPRRRARLRRPRCHRGDRAFVATFSPREGGRQGSNLKETMPCVR